MKGKNNLFKILGMFLLVVIALTWLLKGATFNEGTITLAETLQPVGLWGVFSYLWDYSYFIVAGVFFLVVGGFYGVLNKTNVYQQMLMKIAKKFKGKETVFMILTIVFFALLSAITGATVVMYVIIPLFVSILLMLNYDRLTALAATVGATLVGLVAGLLGETNAAVYLKTTNLLTATNNSIFDMKDFGSFAIYRLLVLVLGVIALVYFLMKYADDNKLPKKAVNKEYDDMFLVKEEKTSKPAWPMVVVFGLVVLISFLSTYAWDVIGVNFFTEITQKIMAWKLNGFPLLQNIIGNIGAFGLWSLRDLMLIMIIASVILILVYKIKWTEAFKVFADSALKMVPVVLLIWMISTILLITFSHPFYLNITDWLLGMSKNFNAVVVAISSIINSALLTEGFYTAQFTLPAMVGVYGAKSADMIALTSQLFNGLTMFVVPTSTTLIVGLYYLEIPFVEWLKFIWKYLVMLLVIIAVVLVLMNANVF